MFVFVAVPGCVWAGGAAVLTNEGGESGAAGEGGMTYRGLRSQTGILSKKPSQYLVLQQLHWHHTLTEQHISFKPVREERVSQSLCLYPIIVLISPLRL
jgi:hypothetical protein